MASGYKSKVSSDKETRGGSWSRLKQKKSDSDSSPNKASMDPSPGDRDPIENQTHPTKLNGYVHYLPVQCESQKFFKEMLPMLVKVNQNFAVPMERKH